jgi:hypothetical protein
MSITIEKGTTGLKGIKDIARHSPCLLGALAAAILGEKSRKVVMSPTTRLKARYRFEVRYSNLMAEYAQAGSLNVFRPADTRMSLLYTPSTIRLR